MQKSLLVKTLLVASSAAFIMASVSSNVYGLDMLADETTDADTSFDITTDSDSDTDTSFDITTDTDTDTDSSFDITGDTNTSDSTLSLDTEEEDDEESSTDTSTLPDTGRISAAPLTALIAVFVAASVYAFKKSNEYKNI